MMNANVAKCLLISKVLIADGMMMDEERGFLTELMKRLGLDEAEQHRVVELEGLDQAESIVLALPVEERQQLVELLVDAASADGKLSTHEHAVIKRAAAVLGV